MINRSHLGYWPIGTVIVLADSIATRRYTHRDSYYVPGETVIVLRTIDARGIVTVRTQNGGIVERDGYTPVWNTTGYQR